VPFERGGLAIAEAPNDLPTRCDCGGQTLPQLVAKDAPLRVKCQRASCGIVYFQKPTAAGAIVLAGHEVFSL